MDVMMAGSAVAYVKDPSLYGVMTVTEVQAQGRLECADAAGRSCGIFDPQELAPAREYYGVPSPVSQAGLPGS